MKCTGKYKIKSWVFNQTVVYTPRYRDKVLFFSFWADMIFSLPLGFFLMGSTRGFVETEEEARQIIEKHKQEAIDQERFDSDCREAKKKFGKTRTICVD